MRVNIEEIEGIMARLNDINLEQLEDIELYKAGEKVEINKDVVKDFKFTGLSNKDFITSGFYINGWTEIK